VTWLLLLHQIPPKPLYLRARVLRRVKQLGAAPLKRSAYLLPDSDEAREDVEWVRREIVARGGDAWVFRVEGLAGMDDAKTEEAFRDLRARDYAELIAEGRALLDALRGKTATAPEDPRRALRRIAQRLDAVTRIDFFQAPGRGEVTSVMSEIETVLHGGASAPAETGVPRGRLWITRRGVKSDRMASAWLIRRFIDPEARFVFVDLAGYRHDGRGLRFDMFEGEYTHEGDRCTFEVLAQKFAPRDPAIAAIAEIIHDIDYKEERYARPETAGVAMLLEGVIARHADDGKRLDESAALFDALHARLGAG
jgi:hypothetical protein